MSSLTSLLGASNNTTSKTISSVSRIKSYVYSWIITTYNRTKPTNVTFLEYRCGKDSVTYSNKHLIISSPSKKVEEQLSTIATYFFNKSNGEEPHNLWYELYRISKEGSVLRIWSNDNKKIAYRIRKMSVLSMDFSQTNQILNFLKNSKIQIKLRSELKV